MQIMAAIVEIFLFSYIIVIVVDSQVFMVSTFLFTRSRNVIKYARL